MPQNSKILLIALIFHIADISDCSAQQSSHFDAIKLFPDSIIYLFDSNQAAEAHKQVTIPLHFRIKLPPDLLTRYAFGMEAFGFLYDQHQVVYIYVDYQDHSHGDTSYRVSNETDIEELLLDRLNMINDESRLDIDHNPYNKERETWLIKKGQATILLYNIRKNDYTRFLDFTNSFAFQP